MNKANTLDLEKSVRFLVLILIGMVCLLPYTFAQTPPSSTSSGLQSDINSLGFIGSSISGIFGVGFLNLFINQGLSLSGNLTGGAQALAGAIALISLVWGVIMSMAQQQSVGEVVIEHAFFVALIIVLIQSYSVLVRQVIDIALWVLNAVTGGDIGSAVERFLSAFWNAIFVGISRFGDTIAQSARDINLFASFLAVLASLGGILFLLVALIFALLAIKDLIGVVLIGPVFLAVGIVLGPLFIATLASPWTRRWFDQWFNFLTSSAFLIAVTGIVLAVLSAVVTGLFANFTGSSYGLIIAMALLASSFGLVFQQIPSMVDAIFPGRTGAGATGKAASSMADSAKGAVSAATSAGNAAKAGGAAASAAAVRAGQAATSGASSARNASVAGILATRIRLGN